MGVWAVVVRETAWGAAGILNIKGVEKLAALEVTAILTLLRGHAARALVKGGAKKQSHQAGGVWSKSTFCVCVCVCVCVC